MLDHQTDQHLAIVAFCRESVHLSDDSLCREKRVLAIRECDTLSSKSKVVTQLLAHIKLLFRRCVVTLDIDLHSKAISHFSKILEGHRDAPQGFLAECYMHKAFALRSTIRIIDCNRTLALNPSSKPFVASLLESIRCLLDFVHYLKHLKLLYNIILCDRKLLHYFDTRFGYFNNGSAISNKSFYLPQRQ